MNEMLQKTVENQRNKFELLKSPIVAEFLGFKNEDSYIESDLESAILTHIRDFLIMSTCDFNVTSNDAAYSWDETSGVLTITEGTVTVSNKDRDTATSQRIYIQGVATVILDGVNISTGAGAPIEIRDYSDTTVTLTLSGSNTLISNTAKKAAIHKTRGQQADSSQAANLIINGSGSLKGGDMEHCD